MIKASLLALLFLSSIWSQQGQSNINNRSSWEIQPVRLHLNTEGQAFAGFNIPCGQSFAGFLYRKAEDDALEIGVLTRREGFQCLELTEYEVLPLPYINGQTVSFLRSIDPSLEPLVLRQVPIQNLHITQSESQEIWHSVYTSQCGRAIGMVLNPRADAIQLGILESSGLNEKSCTRTTAIWNIPGLASSLGPSLDWTAQWDTKNDAPAYELRQVPLRLLEVPSSTPGLKRFALYYLRRCNEAPIGLVQIPRRDGKLLSYLVAHYPERPCTDSGLKKVWTRHADDWQAPDSQSLQALSQPSSDSLTLVRPLSYRLRAQAPSEQNELEIETYSSCQGDLGLISISEGPSHAVAILQSKGRKACLSPLKKVSYTLSIKASEEPKLEIKPLQLLGRS